MQNFLSPLITILGYYIINYIFFLIGILLSVAIYTLLERKFMAAVQRRKGPVVVGFHGVLQPFSDALKLILKEFFRPREAERLLFLFGPYLMLVISLTNWLIIPLSSDGALLDLNYSLIFYYGVSSLGVYGIIISGWASNSKYAFLGAIRSAAQMLSYEVCIGFIFLSVGCLAGSFDLDEISFMQAKTISFVVPLLPLFFVFYICALAETNRMPFDLPEAEAELVSGYNTEYSSMGFTLFFLAEYSNMLLMSFLMVILFFSGWDVFFGLFTYFFKVCLFALSFILVRAILPRVRYDQLMALCWQQLLPISLSYYFFLLCWCKFFSVFPEIYLPDIFVIRFTNLNDNTISYSAL